jgi:hypothetical protein
MMLITTVKLNNHVLVPHPPVDEIFASHIFRTNHSTLAETRAERTQNLSGYYVYVASNYLLASVWFVALAPKIMCFN